MENSLVLTAYLRKEKAKSFTSIPIYLRVTLNKKKALFSVGHYVNPKKWDLVHQTVKGEDPNTSVINRDIMLLRTKIYDIINQSNKDELFIDHEILKKKLEGKVENRKTLIDLFSQHNEKIKSRIGLDYSLGTWKSYNTSRNKTTLFLKHHFNRTDIYLRELNIQFIDDFEHYLKVNIKLCNNSAMKYLQCLKAVVNLAIRNGYIEKNPFIGFSCSYEEVKRDLLNDKELKQLKNQLFELDKLSLVRDIFLFSCYTGLAHADIYKLSKEHIIHGVDGNLWVEIYRTKTNIRSPIPLLPEALEILEKQGFVNKVNGQKLFNVYTNQAINRVLKEVAKESNINKNLTFHMARHTFATTVTLSNSVPIETVSKMLGHTNLKTTQIYAKVIDTKIGNDMKFLLEKLPFL